MKRVHLKIPLCQPVEIFNFFEWVRDDGHDNKGESS